MQNIYRAQMEEGRAGLVADAHYSDIITLTNEDPSTKQVDTIVVDNAVNSTAYTIVIDGVTISYTSDSTATKVEIAAGLVAAIQAEYLVSGKMIAASDGVDTVTCTARYSGVGWTMTESDANLTLTHTTANDEADPVGFGLLVVGDSADDKYGKLCKAANLSAKVVTLTPTVINDTVYNVDIHVLGIGYKAQFPSDGTATAKEIVEGLVATINASMPANTVAATEDDTKITLTAEIAGLWFDVEYDGGEWTYAETTATAYCDVNKCMRGVSVFDAGQETDSSGVTQYAGGSNMSVLTKKRIYVTTEETCGFGDDVYVRITDGTPGAFRKTAVAGKTLKLDPNKAKWHKGVSSTLAILDISM